jgi:DNA-binding response OmpR family regulator
MPNAVLLVDDNEIQASTRKAILTRAGNHVTVGTSAASALLALERPDFLKSLGLVISDHLMPGMNGPEFIRALRALSIDLPVLIISGLEEAETEYEGLDVYFRMKPFAPDQLIALVHSLLNQPIARTA